jgi:hypothetical protein
VSKANVRFGSKADVARLVSLVHPAAMNIAALVPELWQRYRFLDNDNIRVKLGGINEADVARWAGEYEGNGDRQRGRFAT